MIYNNTQFPGGAHFACTLLARTSVFLVKSSTLTCYACSTSLNKLHKLSSSLGLENLSAYICKIRPLQWQYNCDLSQRNLELDPNFMTGITL